MMLTNRSHPVFPALQLAFRSAKHRGAPATGFGECRWLSKDEEGGAAAASASASAVRDEEELRSEGPGEWCFPMKDTGTAWVYWGVSTVKIILSRLGRK